MLLHEEEKKRISGNLHMPHLCLPHACPLLPPFLTHPHYLPASLFSTYHALFYLHPTGRILVMGFLPNPLSSTYPGLLEEECIAMPVACSNTWQHALALLLGSHLRRSTHPLLIACLVGPCPTWHAHERRLEACVRVLCILGLPDLLSCLILPTLPSKLFSDSTPFPLSTLPLHLSLNSLPLHR